MTKPTLEAQMAYAQQLINDGLYPEYARAILASLKEYGEAVRAEA